MFCRAAPHKLHRKRRRIDAPDDDDDAKPADYALLLGDDDVLTTEPPATPATPVPAGRVFQWWIQTTEAAEATTRKPVAPKPDRLQRLGWQIMNESLDIQHAVAGMENQSYAAALQELPKPVTEAPLLASWVVIYFMFPAVFLGIFLAVMTIFLRT